MKKMVIVAITMVLVFMMSAVALANGDPIWEDVYSWWKEGNNELYESFLTTEYGSTGFEKNNYAYFAAYNVYLNMPENLTLKEAEDELTKMLIETYGIMEPKVKINVIGWNSYYSRYVFEINIDTSVDLTKIDGTGFEDFENPVYGCKLICYDRY